MANKELEQISLEKWPLVETFFLQKFEKIPDLQAMLYLIGINEFGHLPARKTFTKDQKQDLIHVAVCSLLAPFDYFMWAGNDDEGWPHYLPVQKVNEDSLENQEQLLKKAIISYFINRNEI